jgi:hypothetical protein
MEGKKCDAHNFLCKAYEMKITGRGLSAMSKKLLYIIVGAMVLVLLITGIGVFAILPTIESASAQQTATPTTIVQPSSTPTPKGSVVNKVMRQYAPEIETEVAQGLHLTSEQLTADLRGGKTLSDVATAQNVSKAQLQTVVANALRMGLKPAVDDGSLTQQQVSRLVKRVQGNPDLLDRLLGGKAVPQITPTPSQ